MLCRGKSSWYSVVAVVDSNPDGDYLIPNDDAMRAITFYCELVQCCSDGLQTELMKSGGDASEAVEAPAEPALEIALMWAVHVAEDSAEEICKSYC